MNHPPSVYPHMGDFYPFIMSKFQPGQSGNPAGRPPGSTHKVSAALREKISLFLDENFDLIKEDLKKLKPADRMRFYIDLLQFGLPKLQAVQIETPFDRLPDDQLDKIIDELKRPDQGLLNILTDDKQTPED